MSFPGDRCAWEILRRTVYTSWLWNQDEKNLELSLTYTVLGRKRGEKIYQQISLRSWEQMLHKCSLTPLFWSSRVFRH